MTVLEDLIQERKITVCPYIDGVFWAVSGRIQPQTPDMTKCVSLKRPVGDWYPIIHDDKVIGISSSSPDITLELSLYIYLLEREKKSGMTFSKDIFLASMSHEIRTPLNGIVGYAQLLQRTEGLTDQQVQLISSLNICCLNLAQLINDILDYSKLSTGKIKLTYSDTTSEEMLSRALDILHSSTGQHRIDVKLENETERITIDKGKIIQILINLVSNAIKFTPPNGTISIYSWNVAPYIYYQIKDTGCGIDPRETHKLFQAFSQIQNDDRSSKGVGLGLAICKRLTELMDGKIEVVSSPQKGSIFTFSCRYSQEKGIVNNTQMKDKTIAVCLQDLKKRTTVTDYIHSRNIKLVNAINRDEVQKVCELYRPDIFVTDLNTLQLGNDFPHIQFTDVIEYSYLDQLLTKKVHKGSLKINTNLRVLIAEDVEYNRELLVKLLKSLGLSQIKAVEDGLQAVVELQSNTYDLLLLDLKMPKMTGYQVYDHIKTQKIRVVPVTAAVEEEERCREMGLHDFLGKPIDVSQLKNILLTT
jgi:CheY-like chemotaxis protein/two-component sensor histidine kinase